MQDRLDVAGALRRLVPEWMCWVLYAGALGSWTLPFVVVWLQSDETSSPSYYPLPGDAALWEQLLQIVGQGNSLVLPTVALMLCVALLGQSAQARSTGRARAGALAGLTVSALLVGVTALAVLAGPAQFEGMPEEERSRVRSQIWLGMVVNQAPGLVLLGAVQWGFGVLVRGRLPFVAVSEAVGDQTDSESDPTPAAEPVSPSAAGAGAVTLSDPEDPRRGPGTSPLAAPPGPDEVAPVPLQPAIAEPSALSGAPADPAADPWVAYRRPQSPA